MNDAVRELARGPASRATGSMPPASRRSVAIETVARHPGGARPAMRDARPRSRKAARACASSAAASPASRHRDGRPADRIDRTAVDGRAGELSLETGEAAVRSCDAMAVPIVPPIAQPGYHRLRFAQTRDHAGGRAAALHGVEDLAPGRRLWGLAVQLYACGAPDDGGIGDFAALAELVASRRRGADALALSPAHSLFAADPSPLRPVFAVEPAVPQSVLRRSCRRVRRGRASRLERWHGFEAQQGADRLAGRGARASCACCAGCSTIRGDRSVPKSWRRIPRS